MKFSNLNIRARYAKIVFDEFGYVLEFNYIRGRKKMVCGLVDITDKTFATLRIFTIKLYTNHYVILDDNCDCGRSLMMKKKFMNDVTFRILMFIIIYYFGV